MAVGKNIPLEKGRGEATSSSLQNKAVEEIIKQGKREGG